MKTIDVKGQARQALGQKSSKSERKNNFIPCVMYGAGKENVHFSAHADEFRHLVYTPHVYTVKLTVDGKLYDAILQQVQYHPVSDKIIHVDFLQIDENKKIVMDVPVKLHGFPVGVKEGGKLAQLKRKLKIRGLMKHLPDVIDIDINDLKIGQAIKVGDMVRDGLEFLDLKNSVITSVKVTRNVVEDLTATADGAPAAAAAAPAAAAKDASKDKKDKK